MNTPTKKQLAQGVLLAKDVLAQVKAGKTLPRQGVTVDSTDDEGHPLNNDGYYSKSAKWLQRELKKAPCDACAKGALFLAWIRRHDGVKPRDFFNELDSMWGYTEDKTELIGVFGQLLLNDIERAFEYQDGRNPTLKLEAIMKALIKSKGEDISRYEDIWNKSTSKNLVAT